MEDYPNSSEAFEAYAVEKPEERKQAEAKENEKITSSVGVITDVLEWFEAKTEQYRSVQSINITESTDPNNVMAQVIAAQRLSVELENKAGEFRRDFAKFLDTADEA